MEIQKETSTAPLTEPSKKNTTKYSIIKWIIPLLKSKTGMLGISIVAIVCFTAVFAPLLAPYKPEKVDFSAISTPPFWMDGGSFNHILGTDNLGRDLLSRIIYGAQISLLVGISSVGVAGVIGVIIGLTSGYYGGLVDTLLMRFVDANIAIPSILFALVVLGFMSPTIITLIIVIGVSSWIGYARVVRSEVLSLKEREYVKAAKSIGVRNGTIMRRHLLPNVSSSVIVIATTSVATTIITEASLSFLGLGPQAVTWGKVLSDGRDYLSTSWWIATFPGIAITITVLGIIFLGDYLRDMLDPRIQE